MVDHSPLDMLDQIKIRPIRSNARLLKELHSAASNGHTHIPEEILISDIEDPNDYRIFTDNGRVYLKPNWEAEVDAADRVKDMLSRSFTESEMPIRPTTGPLIPTDDQWTAIENAFRYPLSCICGYPGTGKTSLIQLLIHAIETHPDYMHSWSKFQLAAPTGKAARRLTQATMRDAMTIHRMLGYNPNSGFMHNQNFPVFGDFIIVDEASMINIQLASALLKAIGPESRLVLVGDAEQLPPIGAGRFFEEMLKADEVPKIMLTKIFRQAEQSLITRNANRIIRGQLPFPDADTAMVELGEDVRPDFFFVEKSTHLIPAAVTELVSERLPKKFKLDINDMLVISPMSRGNAGLDKLNDELKKSLNPMGIPTGLENGFSVGDRVIQTQNDYTVDIMNGEVGTIIDFDIKNKHIHLDLGDRQVWIPDESMDSFLLAYGITIHRSQGSQARVVIVILDKGHRRMHNRRLINTAITRAEDICIVLGQWSALTAGIETVIEDARCDLLQRIRS